MTLRAPYATLSPEFDNFLFAQIGEEGNGMSLSVLSAFTRLDIDPWREAAQLSNLSKEKAVEALAPIIARLPFGRWTAVDIPAIARRLVEFLPRHDVVIQSVATLRAPGKARFRAVYAIFLILMAMVYFGLVARQQAPSSGDATHPVISDKPH